MHPVLITGSTGLVGRALVPALASRGFPLVLTHRREPVVRLSGVSNIIVGDIGADTDWTEALDGCKTVVHLAGQTPGRGASVEALTTVNEHGTQRLAEQAAKAGVSKFVFLSSLHAVAAGHTVDMVTDTTPPRPTSIYGMSKLAAENHIERLNGDGFCAISLRPPLVIDAQAVGNWFLIQRLAASPLPLPVGRLRSKRSVISLDNLVDAIMTLVIDERDAAAGGRFLLTDPQPVSLEEMITLLRRGMERRRRIFSAPESLLRGGLCAVGKRALANNLLGRLEIDGSGFCEKFDWSPKLSTAEGILKSARNFLKL